MKHDNASKSNQRAMVVFCFLLVTTTTTGILVFIDSSSLQVWTSSLDTGPVAMVANGDGIENETPIIRQIDGVTAAQVLDGARGHIRRGEGSGEISLDNVTQAFEVSGIVYSPSSSFLVDFETIFTLLDGKFPENESEVAIPQKIADSAFIGIGYQVNYSYTSIDVRTRLVVVGIYSQAVLSGVDYVFDSIGIIHRSLFNPTSSFARVFVDVDRTPVSPSDAHGALAYANGIEHSIVDLCPGGVYVSRYRVDNYLSASIKSYLNWRDSQRTAQLLRSGGISLLILMVVFSGVQYSVEEKDRKCVQLFSRGASQFRINMAPLREIVTLSLVAIPFGIVLGILASRIAVASDGFLRLNLKNLVEGPFLVTVDSLIIAVTLGVATPIFTFMGYKGFFTAKHHVSEEQGRIARLVRGMSLIRWDLIVVLVSAAMIGAFYAGGPTIQSNVILTLMLSILQLPLFLGIASLAIKAVSRAADGVSTLAKPLMGKIPASIGVRKLARGRYSMSIVAMVFILSTCIMWNGAVVDATLPVTRINHARFAIGADVSFHLSEYYSGDWTSFADSLSAFSPGIASTLVCTGELFLSGSAADRIEFLAIDAFEYSDIGYDQFGDRLNQSSLSVDLTELQAVKTGVIITIDLAETYNLEVNDVLRAFTAIYGEGAIEFTITSIVDALCKPTVPGSGIDQAEEGVVFGHKRIWVNMEYLKTQIDIVRDTDTYCLCATKPGHNDTFLVEQALDEWGDGFVYSNRWTSVDYEVQRYVSQTEYAMDRAIDGMILVISAMAVVAAAVLFLVNNLKKNERSNALLRSMGATQMSLVRIEMAQGLALIILSIGVLALYVPLYIANTLVASDTIYSSWAYVFPIGVFVVAPWPVLVLFLFIFSLEIIVAIAFIAGINGISLQDHLRAYWAKSQPTGGVS